GLHLDRFADGGPAAADRILAQGRPDQVGQEKRTFARGDRVDLALKRAGVFIENSYALLGGQEAQSKGLPLPAHFHVPADKDKPGPDEAAITRDLHWTDEESRPAAGMIPVLQFLAVVIDSEGLVKREANRGHDDEREDQQRPFARWPQ